MNRIELLLEDAEALERLRSWLDARDTTEPVVGDPARADGLDQGVALCILDEPALSERCGELAATTTGSEDGDGSTTPRRARTVPVLVVIPSDGPTREDIDTLATDVIRKPLDRDLFALRLDSLLNGNAPPSTQAHERISTRLDRTIRDTSLAVGRANTRAEIETRICEELSDVDRFVGMWVGRYEDSTETVAPRVTSGFDSVAVEDLRISTAEEGAGQGVCAEALQTADVVVGGPENRPAVAGWQQWLDETGVESVAAIPITHQERRYGLCTCYTTHSTGLSEREREIFLELGRTIGQAIAAIESREQAELFQAAVEHIGYAVYITGTDGTIEYVNPAFEHQTGYTAAEARGETPRILNSGYHDDAFYEALWETLLSNETWKDTFINQGRSGELYQVEQSISPITDDSGTITNFVAVSNEITEQVIREQQIQVLHRVLRHNLRNQLNLIAGHVELISGTNPSVEATESVEMIHETIAELTKISRKADECTAVFKRSLSEQPHPVCSIIEQQCDHLSDRYPAVDYSLETPPEDIYVRRQVDRGVHEILENAFKYADDSDPVVRVVVRPPQADDGVAVLRIVDNGPGIPASERQVIERGEETPLFHGSGLGLWLVYWIVTLAGGEVSIDEPDAGGTAITLTLPTFTPDGEPGTAT